MEMLAVAKKKVVPQASPEGWAKKPLIVNLRGSEAFKTWMQGLAKHDRQSVSGVVERALVHYARAIGYAEEAPER